MSCNPEGFTSFLCGGRRVIDALLAAKTSTELPGVNVENISVFISASGIFYGGAKDGLTRRFSWHMHTGVDYGASARDNDIGYVLAYLSCGGGS